jgi:hypothetical protein
VTGVLAVSEAAWATLGVATAALFGAVGLIGQAALAAKKNALETKEAIGTPNGHGDLATMMAKLLDGQTAQDTRLARSEAWQLEHDRTHIALDAELRAMRERLPPVID